MFRYEYRGNVGDITLQQLLKGVNDLFPGKRSVTKLLGNINSVGMVLAVSELNKNNYKVVTIYVGKVTKTGNNKVFLAHQEFTCNEFNYYVVCRDIKNGKKGKLLISEDTIRKERNRLEAKHKIIANTTGPKIELGKYLKALFSSRSLKSVDVSKQTGITPGHISHIVTGIKYLTFHIYSKFNRVMKFNDEEKKKILELLKVIDKDVRTQDSNYISVRGFKQLIWELKQELSSW